MGQSRLTADQLVAYYRNRSGLAYRASGATLEQLASMFVSEGNRYNVRGDVAFAQSIVETAWFNFPDYGIVRTDNNNFAGIGACDSCGNGYQFSSPLAGVRAQIQLLRNYADGTSSTTTIPDPPVPELWGSTPSTAAYNFDHYFAKGRAPLWNDMGNGNWAAAPNYATVVLSVYNQMLTDSGQAGQCPPDGLLFGSLTAAGPCPVGLRQPGRAIATTGAGGVYVLNGDGNVTASQGAPFFGSPPLADSDRFRDIDVMPDGQGYVVLDQSGRIFRFGSADTPQTLGQVGMADYGDQDVARSISVMPDGQGYVVLLGDGTVLKFGSAATGAMAALNHPSSPGTDDDRSIVVMPDGAGLVVLDKTGVVDKLGSALQGTVGAGSTPVFGGDIARDVEVVDYYGYPLGYYVLDGWGGVAGTSGIPARTDPNITMYRDRWRGLALAPGGIPVLVKNDGSVQRTN
jgi:Mannosyl-glycoprotein endo-beta-N-acetylglucosaminidase